MCGGALEGHPSSHIIMFYPPLGHLRGYLPSVILNIGALWGIGRLSPPVYLAVQFSLLHIKKIIFVFSIVKVVDDTKCTIQYSPVFCHSSVTIPSTLI